MTLQNIRQFAETDDAPNAFPNAEIPCDRSKSDDSLLACFNSQFDALPANNFEAIRTAQRIRYQVYCVENQHERPDHPDGLEMDEFDCHAVQSLLVYRADNAALGTARLILPLANDVNLSFPLQRMLDSNSLETFNRLPLCTMGEVSRFSISRQFRRLADASANAKDTFIANSAVLMRLGLIQSLVRISRQHGITHWCAAMEPSLLRMLSAMGIRFRPVGPLIEYRGLRQPCYCVVADMLQDVERERPAFWSVLTGGGAVLN